MSNRDFGLTSDVSGELTRLSSLLFRRIVLRGREIVNSVVPKSSSVFDFQKAYGLTEEEVGLPPCLSKPLTVLGRRVGVITEAATRDLTLGHGTLSLKACGSVI